MELTDLLTGALASQIGKKADVDEDTTQALLTAALPLLLESMNENSKSKSGAESLAKALSHNGVRSCVEKLVFEGTASRINYEYIHYFILRRKIFTFHYTTDRKKFQ